MKKTKKLEDQIGIKSVLQPSKGELPVTLETVKKEISEEITKAKEDFLKIAKAEADKEIRKQVQTDKTSLITVFGIYASLISFLTIEFQFLKTICSLEKLVGFTLILVSLLLCFNLALDYLVKSRTDTKTPKPNIYFGVFIILLLIIGISFIFVGNEEKCKDNKIYEKYSEDFKNQQMKIQTKIEDIDKQLKIKKIIN